MSFDKEFVKDIFDELADMEVIPADQRANIVYHYKGFRYIMRRIDMRQIPMSQGGLALG